MAIYTAINHQVFNDDAKVFCVCQNHIDALYTAKALNEFEEKYLSQNRKRVHIESRDVVDFENFHPRAMKLIRKKKPFIVIAYDEPYFKMAYDQIRFEETRKGTWTEEDERIYQYLCASSI